MIAVAIAKYLTELAIVTYDETLPTADCFIDDMPPNPDEAVMLKSYGGASASFKFAKDEPRLQALVRGTSNPRVAEARAWQIYNALHGLLYTTMDPDGKDKVYVSRITAIDTPHSIGVDENGRHEYSVNFDVRINNAASANRI